MKNTGLHNLLLAFAILLLSSCGNGTSPTPTTPGSPNPPSPNPNNGKPNPSSLLGTWAGTNTTANFSSVATISVLTNCQEPVPTQVYCNVSGSLSFTYLGKSECALNYSFDDGILATSTATNFITLAVSKNNEVFMSSFNMTVSDIYTIGTASAMNVYYTLESCNITSASGDYNVTKQ